MPALSPLTASGAPATGPLSAGVPAGGTRGLVRAYQAALYRIDAAEPVVLRVGVANPALRHVVAPGATLAGVFLTACNPRSRRLRAVVNARRMRALERDLSRRGLRWRPGCARDPDGLWPDEPSLWVPGLPVTDAIALARRFRQFAFVACDDCGVARLVWVDAKTKG